MKDGNGEGDGRNGDSLDWIKEVKPAKLVSQKLKVRQKRNGLLETVSPTVRYSEQFLRKVGKVRCQGKDWFIFEKGKWTKVKEEVFLPDIIEVIPMEDRNSKRVTDLITFVRQGAQLGRNEEFCGAIKCIEDGYYLLNFSNGTMKLRKETGEIVEWMKHDSGHMFNSSLGEYIEGKDCPFYKRIESQILTKGSDRVLLKHWCASALLPDSRFECALFCIGNGSNGKSILMETLAEAIGNDVRSSLTFHQICSGDRKQVPRLMGKLINVGTEMETKMVEESDLFKKIVSGEPFETEEIYRSGFRMQTNVKLCFLTNHLPSFKWGSEAETRRIRIIQFSKKFDDNNRDLLLKEKLIKDKEGILAMLVRRLPRICGLGNMLDGSLTSQRVYRNFGVSNDIVGSFMEQCTEVWPNSKHVTRNNLYEIFRKFCAKQEKRSIDSSLFFRLLKNLRPELNASVRIHYGNKDRPYTFKDLTFTDYGWDLLGHKPNKIYI